MKEVNLRASGDDRSTVAKALLQALEQNETDLFDDYELIDSSDGAFVQCKKNGTVIVSIGSILANSKGMVKTKTSQIFVNYNSTSPTCMTNVIFCKDAFIVFWHDPSNNVIPATYGYMMAFLKQTDGNLMLLYSGIDTMSYKPAAQQTSSDVVYDWATITIDSQTGDVINKTVIRARTSNNQDDIFIAYPACNGGCGGVATSAFFVTSTRYLDQTVPFPFTVNGEKFVAIYGNMLCVRDE